MVKITGAAFPPAPAPKKTHPWIIVIVMLVILCCFCVGAIGLLLAFGGPILNELGLIHVLLPASMI
jgi:hypothetical protein